MRSTIRRVGLAIAVAIAIPGVSAAQGDPLAMTAEKEFPSIGVALKLPAGVDPGRPRRLDFLGNEGLGFFFGLPDSKPVKVSIETWAAHGDLDAFCRRRIADAGPAAASVLPRKFNAPGFDDAARVELGADRDEFATVVVVFRKGRTIVSATVMSPVSGKGAYLGAVEAFISGIRCIASLSRPILAQEGWNRIESASFELATDAREDVGNAFLSVLEAALAQAKKRFPGARTAQFRRPVLFFGDAEAFAAFKESNSLGQEQSCILLPEQRVIVAGVLPFGKQSRRFAKAEIDVFDAARSVFDLFAIEAAGTSPEPWFTEGAGCLIGMALGSDLEYSERRAEDEMGVALADAFRTGKAMPLEKLLSAKIMDDEARYIAAAWVHFLSGYKLKSKKPALEAYLEAFSASWDSAKAMAAFDCESFKSMTKTLSGRVAFWATRAKRGK